jgi:hypothetical protein
MLALLSYVVLLLVIVPVLIWGLAKAIAVYAPGGQRKRARPSAAPKIAPPT